MFECEAKEGAKLHKCRIKRNFKDMLKHVEKHHEARQYRCQLDGCKNHKKAYETLDEL